MARHLFISQETITKWMDQDKIDFDGNVMTVKADGRRFSLLEAVRFVRVEGDEEDVSGLLGKVKTDEQLVSIGAERYRDSVISGDVAYKVQEGFIGEIFMHEEDDAKPEVAVAPAPVAPAPVPAVSANDPANDLARTQPMAIVDDEPKPASDLGAAVRQASGTEPEKIDGELTDEELLTNFLLENL
ncbi:MAG: hypothetical protein JRF33_01665 [Deltaproteobacteria bacterium]|nr:hypothetical protein [Deltaproteobacteria bacterium]